MRNPKTGNITTALLLALAMAAPMTYAKSRAATTLDYPSPPDWDQPCSDTQYAATDQGYAMTLYSRHKDCRVARSSPVLVTAQLVNDKGTWRYATASDSPSVVVEATVGTAVFDTRWQSFGGNTRLAKTQRIQVRVNSFVGDPTYPMANKKPTVVLSPVIECTGCTFPAKTISRSLGSTAWSSPTDASLTFSWSPSDPSLDMAYFTPRLTKFTYAVDGNRPVAPRTEPFEFSPEINSGLAELRCDRKLADGKTDGCVYHQAAAWLTYSKGDSTVQEVAIHIDNAQKGRVPGGAVSPGRFKLLAGTRAIADGSESSPLTRMRSDLFSKQISRNRAWSCTNAGSVIKLRPQGSATCQNDGTTPGCDCDEYPFASTWNGAYFQIDTGSARYVNSAQNQAAGGRIGNFYQRERVIDLSTSQNPNQGEAFWVQITP